MDKTVEKLDDNRIKVTTVTPVTKVETFPPEDIQSKIEILEKQIENFTTVKQAEIDDLKDTLEKAKLLGVLIPVTVVDPN